jgi:hypothetical protein
MKRLIGGLGMLLALACSSQLSSVRLQGDPRSIASLAGRWGGEYWGASGGRRGSLSFELRPGTDTLYGDVSMMDLFGNTVRPADPADVHRLHGGAPLLLRIEFVMASQDSLRGVLEPYVSPDCDCTVTTSFAGALAEDKINGTFETRSASIGVLAHGFWRMERAP